MKFKTVLLLITGALAAGCYNDSKEALYPAPSPASCNTATVTYNGIIKAATLSNCAYAGCHAGAAPSAGIELSTYDGLKRIADDSSLMGSIRHESGYSPMPKGADKLSDCLISQYAAWVAAGAPNN